MCLCELVYTLAQRVIIPILIIQFHFIDPVNYHIVFIHVLCTVGLVDNDKYKIIKDDHLTYTYTMQTVSYIILTPYEEASLFCLPSLLLQCGSNNLAL